MSRRVLILGGGSGIALAYARIRAAKGCAIVLAGRRPELLQANAADLKSRGAEDAIAVEIDLADLSAPETRLSDLLAGGFPDEVLIAYGSLPDQAAAERDLALASAAFRTNFESPALWILALLRARPFGRPLSIAVIGSVAGDRGRGSNFIYGAAKGGLGRLVEGLQHAYAANPDVSLTLVKPGFVRTPMTEGIANRNGPLWADPDKVGAQIAKAVDARRAVVYTPAFWGLIMLVIRHLPRAIFNRMKI
jgi:short-subunit dehydrogenase